MIFIRTAFGGIRVGAKGLQNLLSSLNGLIVLVIICIVIYWLVSYIPKLIFAIRDYQTYGYPYKAVSFFYHWVFNLIELITAGPFNAGEWVYAFSLTKYNNLNLILGVITGVALYILSFSALVFTITLSKQSIPRLLGYVLLPGLAALVYFLIFSFIQWTFTSDALQVQNNAPIESFAPTGEQSVDSEAAQIKNEFESASSNESVNYTESPVGLDSTPESISENANNDDMPAVTDIEDEIQATKVLETHDSETNCSPAARSLNQC